MSHRSNSWNFNRKTYIKTFYFQTTEKKRLNNLQNIDPKLFKHDENTHVHILVYHIQFIIFFEKGFTFTYHWLSENNKNFNKPCSRLKF